MSSEDHLKKMVVIGSDGKEHTYTTHRGGNKLGGECYKNGDCEKCMNINC